MLIRLWSDLHLEHLDHAQNIIDRLINFSKTINHDTKNVLILAGDIGNPANDNYKYFLENITKYYDKTFIIAGNHEYYNFSDIPLRKMDQVNELITEIVANIPNLHFLNRSSYVYENIRFIGCTLWTKSDPELSQFMNDYNYIPDMTPELCESQHKCDVDWLKNELPKIGDYDTTCVITHHLPTNKLVAKKYKNHYLNTFFANNLDNLVKQSDIWCCGHSHMSRYTKIGNCECYLNPLGYHNENSNFREDWIIMKKN